MKRIRFLFKEKTLKGDKTYEQKCRTLTGIQIKIAIILILKRMLISDQVAAWCLHKPVPVAAESSWYTRKWHSLTYAIVTIG